LNDDRKHLTSREIEKLIEAAKGGAATRRETGAFCI
jgi:hypothetical protein